MAWNGAWHAANLLSGNDADSDKEKEKEYFDKIRRDDAGTDSGKSDGNGGNENSNDGIDSGKSDENGGEFCCKTVIQCWSKVSHIDFMNFL